MVQHDGRVQMQGRRGAGAAASGRRREQNMEVVSFPYDDGEEWYEEEGRPAAGQGRNPYLEEYGGQYSRGAGRREAGNGWGEAAGGRTHPGQRRRQVEVPLVSGRTAPSHAARPSGERGRVRQSAPGARRAALTGMPDARRPMPAGMPDAPGRAAAPRGGGAYYDDTYDRNSARAAARARRRRRVLMQRIVVCLWVVCILLGAVIFLLRNDKPSAAGDRYSQTQSRTAQGEEDEKTSPSSALVQGLPAAEFAKHPDWEENFLTPNEYSRPGDSLESVKNIFVHYTANPGTSAAQNRSYFEQQKDVHQVSVSSHFIIGYEGEILQCVPLDEVAYAVQTRNYDSISIECCHLEKDGSFTQETYDSLIALLAWLTDVYDLDTEDILRHYDCGGKKCPLYYTENPDAWEQLKKDVDKL